MPATQTERPRPIVDNSARRHKWQEAQLARNRSFRLSHS